MLEATPTKSKSAQPGASAELRTESHIVLPGDPACGLILICDHARNWLPDKYASLGMPREAFERHIAYDIGVEGVTRGVSERLGVPAIFATYSRLLIDPNRGLLDPTSIMQISDGQIVPGNAGIAQEEREYRIETYYRPYHAAIDKLIDDGKAAGKIPAVISIHSFTPSWKGVLRPWHAGILWQPEEPRVAVPLLEALSRDHDIIVGDNEPYRGGLAGDTLDTHGTKLGIANALIEIRQDLIADAAGIDEWIDRIVDVLPAIVARPGIHQIRAM